MPVVISTTKTVVLGLALTFKMPTTTVAHAPFITQVVIQTLTWYSATAKTSASLLKILQLIQTFSLTSNVQQAVEQTGALPYKMPARMCSVSIQTVATFKSAPHRHRITQG